ncbi:hypothetical protein ABW19_dt0206146 [Dactylella cylindrospora]|nr:hypothetical protein ABW19_dt0206146 [Dactylella cylindrospora]
MSLSAVYNMGSVMPNLGIFSFPLMGTCEKKKKNFLSCSARSAKARRGSVSQEFSYVIMLWKVPHFLKDRGMRAFLELFSFLFIIIHFFLLGSKLGLSMLRSALSSIVGRKRWQKRTYKDPSEGTEVADFSSCFPFLLGIFPSPRSRKLQKKKKKFSPPAC